MKISFPYNVTRPSDGHVIEATRAFANQHAGGWKLEYGQATRTGVPREQKGSVGFGTLLRQCGDTGVKWAYTVHRELFIIPQTWGPNEVPHSFAAQNLPVFCAGFASLAGDTVTVDNWTGHYQVPALRAPSDIVEAWAGCGFVVHVGDLIR